MKNKNKFKRPDLVVGHFEKRKKEQQEDAIFTLIMGLLVLIIYALYIMP